MAVWVKRRRKNEIDKWIVKKFNMKWKIWKYLLYWKKKLNKDALVENDEIYLCGCCVFIIIIYL